MVALTAKAEDPADARADVHATAPSTKKAPEPKPTFRVQAGLDGEIFPVFASYAAMVPADERRWGTIAVTVTNSSDAVLHDRISVKVPGWSDEEIQMVELPVAATHTYVFAPAFLDRLYKNRELKAATAVVTASDAAGHVVFQGTAPVRLRAAQDMYWGDGFEYAPFIASWVTPHDARVEHILGVAKEFMPGRRLPGYESWKNEAQQEESVQLQARAIFRALQKQGLSYVKSSLTFGGNDGVSERVRLPEDSLRDRSANCIDAAVLYASLFENLDLQPVVVLVPGHAYVGVRLARGSPKYLYIETSLTGRASFESAVATAQRAIQRLRPNEVRLIHIDEARSAGIYPMP